MKEATILSTSVFVLDKWYKIAANCGNYILLTPRYKLKNYYYRNVQFETLANKLYDLMRVEQLQYAFV